MTHDPRKLPLDLLQPIDDGACDHLQGRALPTMYLAATSGDLVDVAAVPTRWTVLYLYPRTGIPGVEMPEGWDAIPGARGCTPQACSYRNEYAEFEALGASVFGLSTQTTEAQREFVQREHIPFPLLSDPDLKLAEVLRLPTFEVERDLLYKRATLIARKGVIAEVRYPVFPPNTDAGETLSWLRDHAAIS